MSDQPEVSSSDPTPGPVPVAPKNPSSDMSENDKATITMLARFLGSGLATVNPKLALCATIEALAAMMQLFRPVPGEAPVLDVVVESIRAAYEEMRRQPQAKLINLLAELEGLMAKKKAERAASVKVDDAGPSPG